MFGAAKKKKTTVTGVDEYKKEQEETAKIYADFIKSFEVDDTENLQMFVRGGVINPNENFSTSLKSENDTSEKIDSITVSNKNSYPVETEKIDDSVIQNSFQTGTNSKPREIDLFLEEIKKKQELLDIQKTTQKKIQQLFCNESSSKHTHVKMESLDNASVHSQVAIEKPEYSSLNTLRLVDLSSEITEDFIIEKFKEFGNILDVKLIPTRSEIQPLKPSVDCLIVFESYHMAQKARKNWFENGGKIDDGKLNSCVDFHNRVSVDVSNSELDCNIESAKIFNYSDISNNSRLIQDPIKVYAPKDSAQKIVIDLLAQYVAEDGFCFECYLKEKELDNQMFKFVFESNTNEANYYRWRVFSLCQGDTLKNWRSKPFKIWENGVEWIPPESSDEARKDKRSNFSDTVDNRCYAKYSTNTSIHNIGTSTKKDILVDQTLRDELELILRNLTRERSSIKNAMVFCLDHSEYAQYISEILMESLTSEETPIDAKISRLYLISDILYNLSCSKQPAWSYRSSLEKYLPLIFDHHNKILKSLQGKLTVVAMKERILSILRIWEEWAVYPPLYTKGLEASFLKDEKLLDDVLHDSKSPLPVTDKLYNVDIDGISLPEEKLLEKYPFWIRKNLIEWNSLDVSNLQQLCSRRGLSCRLESTPGEDVSSVNSSFEDEKKQFLIKRLIEFELYWRNRQIKDSK